MSQEKPTLPTRSVARFQVTKSQSILALIALFAILALGFSSISSSRQTVREAKVLSDVETPAASIIFTQRETLVYAARLAQWSNGGTPRRTVQIARNLLAQRLAVIDTSGRSMGSRARPNYWMTLKESDDLVASAPAGILPESLHKEYNEKVTPIIDEILAEARRLVVEYQRSFDQQMIKSAMDTANRDRTNLIYFYTFLIAATLFLILNVRTNFKNYQYARSALEREQIQLDATLEELRNVQTSLVELQNLDAAKDAFISTVNHELRTPLTSIIGYLDFIRDQDMTRANPELEKYLEVLDRNAQILLNLVESMLSISKLDAEGGKLAEDKVSINEVIDNAIFIIKPVSEKSNIAITFNADEELFVQGDAGQLSQVYINLIANAVKFSPAGSTVEIILDVTKGSNGREFSRVQVHDNGIGIPQEDIDHLFTRFFRAKNADAGQFPGTGLGLSIVQQVVTRHEGKVSVSSVLGKGTTFTVEIPLFLTSEEKMILGRRNDVLARAITSLEKSTPETLKSVTHEIGGALGFYQFEELGHELLEVSRSLEDSEISLVDFAEQKRVLLIKMRNQLEKAKDGSDE